jgi:Fic family protein
MPFSCTVGSTKESPVASFTPEEIEKTTKENEGMAKSLEALSEVVTNQKHPFRKVDNQPKKPLKHRYERRKIKEYLHLGDWISGESPEIGLPNQI